MSQPSGRGWGGQAQVFPKILSTGSPKVLYSEIHAKSHLSTGCLKIKSQSLEDTQVGYISQKYTWEKYTFGKYTFRKYSFGKYTFGKYTLGKYTLGKYTSKFKKQSPFISEFCFWEDPPHPVNWSPNNGRSNQFFF